MDLCSSPGSQSPGPCPGPVSAAELRTAGSAHSGPELPCRTRWQLHDCAGATAAKHLAVCQPWALLSPRATPSPPQPKPRGPADGGTQRSRSQRQGSCTCSSAARGGRAQLQRAELRPLEPDGTRWVLLQPQLRQKIPCCVPDTKPSTGCGLALWWKTLTGSPPPLNTAESQGLTRGERAPAQRPPTSGALRARGALGCSAKSWALTHQRPPSRCRGSFCQHSPSITQCARCRTVPVSSPIPARIARQLGVKPAQARAGEW